MEGRVYVANLPTRMNGEDLSALFERFGEIRHVEIMQDPRTQQSRGYGFVQFGTHREAEEAVQSMSGYADAVCQPRQPHPPRPRVTGALGPRWIPGRTALLCRRLQASVSMIVDGRRPGDGQGRSMAGAVVVFHAG